MATLFELEPLVMTLPLHDEDEGVAEALHREAEAASDPSVILSLEEFQSGIAAMSGR
jgi:hypothetical protein